MAANVRNTQIYQNAIRNYEEARQEFTSEENDHILWFRRAECLEQILTAIQDETGRTYGNADPDLFDAMYEAGEEDENDPDTPARVKEIYVTCIYKVYHENWPESFKCLIPNDIIADLQTAIKNYDVDELYGESEPEF